MMSFAIYRVEIVRKWGAEGFECGYMSFLPLDFIVSRDIWVGK